MLKKAFLSPFPLAVVLFCFVISISISAHVTTALDEEAWEPVGSLVKKEQRRSLVSTEYGEISSVRVSDGTRGSYHLQFITMEPDSLFLPVLLHADMIFYVRSGSGRLSWADEDEMRRVNFRRGDVYRLRTGSVFFIQSNLEPDRQKLRIYAVFANSGEDLHAPLIGAYSSIRDLLLGFDRRVLQAAFKVPEEVIEEITNGTKPPAIVHGVPTSRRALWEIEVQFMNAIIGSKGHGMFDVNKKRERTRLFNMLTSERDFENCNGWSLEVTKKKLPSLRGSHIGIFMVNLTKGSMVGPHWNPLATEIGVVIQGQGMIRVVCSSAANETECKNMRFRVGEGDVFAVPQFHPMAQMSFNNDTFVFVGFSTTSKKSHPQFLAGKSSVLQTLDNQILAASFGVTNTTIDHLLAAQSESIILDCTSCAEEEERIMEQEREEARKREEEQAQQEEEKRREAAAREEEEEAKRQEEERERQQQGGGGSGRREGGGGRQKGESGGNEEEDAKKKRTGEESSSY